MKKCEKNLKKVDRFIGKKMIYRKNTVNRYKDS